MTTGKPSQIATATAVRYWVRRQSERWSSEDQRELDHWLAGSAEHRAAFDVVGRTWAEAGALVAYRRAPVARDRRPWPAGRVALAAVAATLVLAVPIWRMAHPPVGESATVERTAVGSTREIRYAEGVRLVMDGSTEIESQFVGGTRRIAVRRGEIYVETTPGAGRLEVTAGRGRLVDIGTRFDVELLHDAVRVRVLEGRLAIGTPKGQQTLEGGQSGGYDLAGVLYRLPAETGRDPSWQHGERRFEAAALEDVLERTRRYHDVEFDFQDTAARDLRVSGTFRLTDLGLFLRSLEEALPVRFQAEGPGRYTVTVRHAPDARGT